MDFDKRETNNFERRRITVDLLIDELHELGSITRELEAGLRIGKLRNDANAGVNVLLDAVRQSSGEFRRILAERLC